MKHCILLGALALLTACGSSRKAEEARSVERYHQRVTASVRVADSLAQRRVLVLDSPVIEIELPAESAASARRVRIAARRAVLAEEATVTAAFARDSAATTVADRDTAAKQTTSRNPWLLIGGFIVAIALLLRILRR